MFPAKPTTVDVIMDLKRVDTVLREMVCKYEDELDRTNLQLKTARRTRLVGLLRRRKLMLGYVQQCEVRMSVCLQKQCALEQLEITRMQILAIQRTSRIFKMFTKKHAIEKVERLQETMVELQENMMDVTDLLAEPILQEDMMDVEEELEEMLRDCGCDSVTVPLVFPTDPVCTGKDTERVQLLAL
jgi:hypothetical protein